MLKTVTPVSSSSASDLNMGMTDGDVWMNATVCLDMVNHLAMLSRRCA
jgi:hypothetical protein